MTQEQINNEPQGAEFWEQVARNHRRQAETYAGDITHCVASAKRHLALAAAADRAADALRNVGAVGACD